MTTVNPLFDTAESGLLSMYRRGQTTFGNVEWRDPRSLIPEYIRPYAEGCTVTIESAVKGIAKPIHISPRGRIFDGHNRVVAAIEAGLHLVPVVIVKGNE